MNKKNARVKIDRLERDHCAISNCFIFAHRSKDENSVESRRWQDDGLFEKHIDKTRSSAQSSVAVSGKFSDGSNMHVGI